MKIRKKIGVTFFFAVMFLFIEELFALQGPKPMEVGRPKEEYKGRGLKDPFKDVFQETYVAVRPVQVEQEIAPPELKVQGIILGGRFNQAIMNNKVVKVGDTIEGATITEISRFGTTVLFNKKTFNISSPAVNMMQEAATKPEDTPR